MPLVVRVIVEHVEAQVLVGLGVAGARAVLADFERANQVDVEQRLQRRLQRSAKRVRG